MNYKSTLNLPQTQFQMKANLAKREPEILTMWEESGLSRKIVEAASTRQKRYILHDGPPYANGNIHLGHALNKILKDIIVKSKSMMGYAVEYVPGWDCHGLPIELQVEKILKKEKAGLSKLEIRRRCRDYAKKYVAIQRDEFKRLGIFGEWDNPYLTMDFAYQAAILRELGRCVEKGLVYKGKKPVHWCSSCRTALAEAEVEHMSKRSPTVFVKFPVKDAKGSFEINPEKGTFFVIWTTTPWTLPANLAIALSPTLAYRLVKTPVGDLILTEDLISSCMEKFGFDSDSYEIAPVAWMGNELDQGITCAHPWINREIKVIVSDHVTNEAGTGCVHIAPGHGQEDYDLGLQYGLDVYAPVNDYGKFTEDVKEFAGQFVFDANDNIVEHLRTNGSLIFKEDIEHSYPHCWRCKKPVIFRATEQWFVSMDAGELRKKSLAEIDRVNWTPPWGRDRIYNMVMSRPDWCISRQRAWGVPITAFICKSCGASLFEKGIMDHIAAMFEDNGADIWFEKDVNELLPADTSCKKCYGMEFIKEGDILDVWFDSGVSFTAVLETRPNLSFPADLYLEGSDQHRGWFQSSLLISMGTRETAPYKRVLTHGFVVDGSGKKMSKSVGNVIAPQDVMDKYGVEVIRLWVAAEDYREDIRVSNEILTRISEAYRRIRNTCRYILGNLFDFNPKKDIVSYNDLSELDRLTLHRLAGLTEKVLTAYESFEFHTIYHAIHNFAAVDLSSFYLDILKDRLYVSKSDSRDRRSAQTTIYYILDHLTRLLAPVLPFTMDEVWGFIPSKTEESVHLASFPTVKKEWLDQELSDRWERLLAIKGEVAKALEQARKEKVIGHPLDARVLILPPENIKTFLTEMSDDLKDISIISQLCLVDEGLQGGAASRVLFESETISGLKIYIENAKGKKCERCWHYSEWVGEDKEHPTICERCRKVVGPDA